MILFSLFRFFIWEYAEYKVILQAKYLPGVVIKIEIYKQ